jgi:hypothetical protein
MAIWIMWMYLGGAIAVALGGLTLLTWARLADRARGRRRCPSCWYSMEGAVPALPLRCPECGREVRRARDLLRTRRRWNWVRRSALVFAVAAILAIQPKVQVYGWGSMTPTTLLLFLYQFDDAEWVRRGITYQVGHDLFHRRRAPDFLDARDPAKAKAMWRWQWRWLCRTLLSRLEDDDVDEAMRRGSIGLLALCAEFGGDPHARDAVVELVRDQMHDDDAWVRGAAFMMAVDYDDIDDSIARMVAFLDDDDRDARWGAMRGLRALAIRSPKGVGALLELLEDERPDVRGGAASSLGFVARRRGTQPEVYQAVIALKDDPECDVRWMLVATIAKMQAADEAWRTIESAMRSEDICVRRGGFSAATSMHVSIDRAVADARRGGGVGCRWARRR